MADFATVAELETFMGTPSLGARGTAMLGYASAQIRAYTRQDLELTLGRQEEYAGEWDRLYISLTQLPVTAVTSITINAVAFTDHWTNYISGDIYRTDGGYWTEGPIIVTYDSGYGPTSDEIIDVKSVCLEMVARALGGSQDTFGSEIPELRGAPPLLMLTDEEKHRLDSLMKVGVG